MEPKQGVFGSITSFVQSIGKKSSSKNKEANIKDKVAKFSANPKDLASSQIKESKSKQPTPHDSPIAFVHDAEISGSLLNSQKLYKDSNITEMTIDNNFFGGLYSEEENPETPKTTEKK